MARLGFAFGAVALAAAGLALGMFFGRSSSDRPADPRVAPSRPVVQVSAALEALRREVDVDSAPTSKLLAFAHRALDEGQLRAAIRAYDRVLAREPGNVEAITHTGIILYAAGHVDQALARLDEALRISPDYAHAHWDRAHMLFHGRRDYAGAARTLEAFLRLVPRGPDAEAAHALLTEARQQGRRAAGAILGGRDRQ